MARLISKGNSLAAAKLGNLFTNGITGTATGKRFKITSTNIAVPAENLGTIRPATFNAVKAKFALAGTRLLVRKPRPNRLSASQTIFWVKIHHKFFVTHISLAAFLIKKIIKI